ncbi:MAG: amidohydrolase family protein [Nitrospirota bacterium]
MKIIDLHTHGIAGYDTRTTRSGGILKITEIHGSLGVSEILLAVYPSPVETMRRHMETIRRAMEEQHSAFKKCSSARILGVYLEGPFINPVKCGALDVRSCLPPSLTAFRRLVDGYEDIVKVVTVAPELGGAVRLIKKIADMGITVNMGHADATYAEAEAGFRAGAGGITHIFNAMSGFHHREPGIAGFGLMNREVYIEVIADPFHLHEKTLEFIFRTKPADRIMIVSDSVKETGGILSRRGVRDGNGRLLGGSMSVTESADRLIRSGLRKDFVMRCITKNPERFLSGD